MYLCSYLQCFCSSIRTFLRIESSFVITVVTVWEAKKRILCDHEESDATDTYYRKYLCIS